MTWLLGLGCLVAGFIGGAVASRVLSGLRTVVVAREFRVVDETGEVRAMLDVGEFGPRLSLFDEKGKARAVLSVDEIGSRLTLGDENGKPGAGLDVSKDGSKLRLFDEAGHPRAALMVMTNFGPRLGLHDEKGELIWTAP